MAERCKRCQSEDLQEQPSSDPAKGGQIVCGGCKAWVRWGTLADAPVTPAVSGVQSVGSWQSRAENLMIAIAATGMKVEIGQYQRYVAEADALATEAQRARNGGRR